MTKLSTITCRHYSRCSGCVIPPDETQPPVYQQLKKLFPTLSLHHGDVASWRTRAKLAIRGTPDSPLIGLFKQNSHEVYPIPDCPHHLPAINQAIVCLQNAIIALQIKPYQEEVGRGLLRYVQCTVDRKSGLVQLVLVVNQPAITENVLQLITHLKQKQEWHSIWVNFQPQKTNRIFGDAWELFHGEKYLWETFNNLAFCFHPACFTQAHPKLFAEILQSIQKMVAPHKRVVEYYSGVGLIGLQLAEQSKDVISIEINPFAAECFAESYQQLSTTLRNKCRFHLAKTEDALHLLENAEVVIVDPPRKGLDQKFISALHAEQLIYVSCHTRTFLRDAEILQQNGWKIDTIEAYLLFPGTDQLEIVCSFKK